LHDLDKNEINLSSEQMQDSMTMTPAAASSAKRNSFYHLILKQFYELILSLIFEFIIYAI